MADFTKGPWALGGSFGLTAVELTACGGDVLIGRIMTKRVGDANEVSDWPEGMANAALAVAAPDLFEALGRCESIIDDFVAHLSPEEQALDPEVGEALTAVRAAIAKATGGAL